MKTPKLVFELDKNGELIQPDEGKLDSKPSGSLDTGEPVFFALELNPLDIERTVAQFERFHDSNQRARYLALGSDIYTGKRGPRTKHQLVGKRFERLVVMAPNHHDNKRGLYWRCKCDCGTIKVVLTRNLVHGNVKSCGCLKEQLETGTTPSEHKIIKNFFKALVTKNSK